MTPKDRDYFMLRAEQETRAARNSTNRQVRGRHEELAWLYQMRVQFFDRAEDHEALEVSAGDEHVPVPHITIAA